MQQYRDRITVEPGKRGGKPCVRGLRITVYDVLDYLASGMDTQELLSDFPELTLQDKIIITTSNYYVNFVKSPTRNYFQVLATKLNWAKS